MRIISTMQSLRKEDIQFGTTTGFNREMVDCVLSIAVVHHLSSYERRLESLRERCVRRLWDL